MRCGDQKFEVEFNANLRGSNELKVFMHSRIIPEMDAGVMTGERVGGRQPPRLPWGGVKGVAGFMGNQGGWRAG